MDYRVTIKTRFINNKAQTKAFTLAQSEVEAHKRNFPNMYIYEELKPPKPTKKMKVQPETKDSE